MDVQLAQDKVDEVTVLDVREPHEWDAGHIDGSVHIPMNDLPQRLAELDPGQPILAVCRSGARSGQVADFLVKRGYTVDNLEGGLQDWARAGHPLASSNGGAGTVA